MRLNDVHKKASFRHRIVNSLLISTTVIHFSITHSYAAVNINEYDQSGSGWSDAIQPVDFPKVVTPSHPPTNAQPLSVHNENDVAWVDNEGLSKTGRSILSTLYQSQDHGLSPARYHVEKIEKLNQSAASSVEARDKLNDMLLHSVAAYAQDLQYGATSQPRHDKLSITAVKPPLEETIATIKQQIHVVDWLTSIAPHSLIYSQLRQSMAHYLDIKNRGGWPKYTAKSTIKSGETHQVVPSLVKILTATGDYSGHATNSSHYHGAVVDAVKHFQKRHGLTPDGTIGPATREALNVPVEERINQIRLTMERVREMPHDLGSKYIVVNIPAFELSAYENGHQQLAMPVIVGRQERKTPIFSNQITQAEFNPVWHVPSSIARKDIIRHIQEDPAYLSKGNFTVSSNGEEVVAENIDWSTVDTDNFPYQFRQASGDKNALGKVKFTLPDNQSVYLHDTSDRRLFAKDFRALSSGCIRVSDPKALAKYVLKGNDGWSEDKINRSFDSHRNFAVKVTPVPVHTVYWTAWTDHTGTLHFRNDLYKKDQPMLAALGPLNHVEALQLASR